MKWFYRILVSLVLIFSLLWAPVLVAIKVVFRFYPKAVWLLWRRSVTMGVKVWRDLGKVKRA